MSAAPLTARGTRTRAKLLASAEVVFSPASTSEGWFVFESTYALDVDAEMLRFQLRVNQLHPDAVDYQMDCAVLRQLSCCPAGM